ncbi:PIN domain-containing protein [Rathayibacter soli]|uniref:PIN domain-containing protein n=1 Tax=Rathayibacter soli TaxID=3144168 RepID=UPI0027E59239|nr:PIN domain-containing protein [Glaciibacter superstes]
MTAGSLDANVVLRLLLNDVPKQHAQAVALINSGGSFAISDTALIETNFVLGRAYGLTRAQQREAIVGILLQPSIRGNLECFANAFELYVEHPALSFEDCYLVVAADAGGNSPLWTFDKKLANQSTARLLKA